MLKQIGPTLVWNVIGWTDFFSQSQYKHSKHVAWREGTFNTEGGDVFLLKLTRKMSLDKGRLFQHG